MQVPDLNPQGAIRWGAALVLVIVLALGWLGARRRQGQRDKDSKKKK